MLLLNNKRVMYRQYSNVFLITQLNNLEAYAAFLVGDGLMRFCVTVVGYFWVHLPDFLKHVSQAYEGGIDFSVLPDCSNRVGRCKRP